MKILMMQSGRTVSVREMIETLRIESARELIEMLKVEPKLTIAQWFARKSK